MMLNFHSNACVLLFLTTTFVGESAYGQQGIKAVPSNIPSGNYSSPDGKYVFQYSSGDAGLNDSANLYCRSDKRKTNLLDIKDLKEIDGFAWVPNRKHTLVFAVRRIKGKPFMAMWNGEKIKVLLAGNLPEDVDSAAEHFSIVGVSTKGDRFIYTHFDATTSYKESIIRKTSKRRYGFVLPK